LSVGAPVVNRNGHISAMTVTPNNRMPMGSSESGRDDFVRVSGRSHRAAAIAATESGTFIQKMPRHPSTGPPIAIASPPSVGPNAVAMPMVAPNRPKALPRSAPWKSCCTSPRTCGIWMPAATPCSRRAIRSTAPLGASAHARLVTVKRLSPMMNSARRERWSPMRPAGTSVRPKVST
jgi:hypothetical protein